VARLILDTGALIALERAEQLDESLHDDDDVAIAAVTAAELLVGVELADRPHHEERQAFVEGVLERVQIIAYDVAVARHHATLLAHARRAGRPRGAHDLQIAATARASNRTIITTDQTAFTDLPEVTLRLFGSR
jgi:tRNA(fMet)-specific endonuclease VapC